MPHLSVDRRTFLAGALALGAAACGDDDTAAPRSPTTSALPTVALAASFPQSGFAITGVAQRLPFILTGSDGSPLDRVDGSVPMTFADEKGTIVSRMTVQPHSDGVPRPYLPVTVTAQTPGIYTVTATYQGTDATSSVQFSAPGPVMGGAATLPQPGSRFPKIDSPTTTDARGVDPICTNKPACPLHGTNIADALAAGRPMVVLVSTPLYCQSSICGPVLDLTVEVSGSRPDVAFIHCEVYANPGAVASIAEATAAPVPTALGLQFEPSMFFVGKDGTVSARLDTVMDRSEISAALATIS